jgi:hypothetical protein
MGNIFEKSSQNTVARYYIITVFSVVLMALADTNYSFVWVDIGSYGKYCDSTIFQRSAYSMDIMLKLPNDRPLSVTEVPNAYYFFVRDERFALNRIILRPYVGSKVSARKKCTIIVYAEHEGMWNVLLEFSAIN